MFKKFFIIYLLFFVCTFFLAQDVREMTISDALSLALEHHPQLKLAEQSVKIAKQQKKVTQLQKLPSLEASASAFYLGDALVIDKDFSETSNLDMPHFGNTYSVEASELIFKGGAVRRSLEINDLKTQLAQLNLENNKQAIKFLVISNYLDMMKANNQKQVLQNNLKLAEVRLAEVKKFYGQGMVTRNEVIRGELMIQNLKQRILNVENTVKIINYNLNQALGFPVKTIIVPTEKIILNENEESLDDYMNLAYSSHPELKSAATNLAIAKKNSEIIKTEKSPAIALFGGYSMAKPITTTLPVIDMYSNTWETGVSLKYNIDNLYKGKEKEELGKLQEIQAKDAEIAARQNVENAVNTAFTRYQEAVQNAKIQLKSQELAQENYKIIEAKYLNQLAVQVEMTDASNARLEAELNYVNSEINVMYQYYNLLRTTGTL